MASSNTRPFITTSPESQKDEDTYTDDRSNEIKSEYLDWNPDKHPHIEQAVNGKEKCVHILSARVPNADNDGEKCQYVYYTLSTVLPKAELLSNNVIGLRTGNTEMNRLSVDSQMVQCIRCDTLLSALTVSLVQSHSLIPVQDELRDARSIVVYGQQTWNNPLQLLIRVKEMCITVLTEPCRTIQRQHLIQVDREDNDDLLQYLQEGIEAEEN